MSARFGKLGWVWLSVFVIVIDLTTKYYFNAALADGRQIVVIPDLLNWALAYNTGAAFSFLSQGSGWQRWFFALIAIVVSVVLVVWMKRLKSGETWLAIGLALVLGGALGNLYDRMIHGHVIDFIFVYWKDVWRFPVFNLADCAITVGAVLLALDMFKSKKPEEEVARD
ncbi:signal peptidase II [Pseudomonas sp. URMO17WK12:I1]|uniref:signal peptidase II n=1 Tax=unclassified Pseudomonas TaxID=196821 RepID=UPI0004893F83|nr:MULTISPECIES: signal peptidase II [unclassified Pseudomonas]PZW65223.1 signal peptidase II [Pseudomonas sp. URMO17WK12:I1]